MISLTVFTWMCNVIHQSVHLNYQSISWGKVLTLIFYYWAFWKTLCWTVAGFMWPRRQDWCTHCLPKAFVEWKYQDFENIFLLLMFGGIASGVSNEILKYSLVNSEPENFTGNISAKIPLQSCHNERDGISNHQPHDCLLNRLFRHRSKKTLELHVTGLCAGNSPVTGEFPSQKASNAGNVSIWWCHHARVFPIFLAC